MNKLIVKYSIVKSLSCVRLFVTLWAVAYLASLSMGFSRQEYWSGLPFPSSGDLPNSGIEPESPALEADALTSEPPEKPIVLTETKFLQHFYSITSSYVNSVVDTLAAACGSHESLHVKSNI